MYCSMKCNFTMWVHILSTVIIVMQIICSLRFILSVKSCFSCIVPVVCKAVFVVLCFYVMSIETIVVIYNLPSENIHFLTARAKCVVPISNDAIKYFISLLHILFNEMLYYNASAYTVHCYYSHR